MKYVRMLYVLALGAITQVQAEHHLKCNGHASLCSRRYNEVAYPATHNGQSHEQSDVHNQDLDLREQLKRGIRATKVHVWYDCNEQGEQVPFVCHGIDKAVLYNPPIEEALESVPFLFRPFARTVVEKAEPLKEIITDALKHAYGTDNAGGAIPFKHCILDPARRPLCALLSQVKDFLDKNKDEVVTLILEDHTRNLERISHDFSSCDLTPYVHTQDKTKAWPTLQEMIENNKRLVVFFHGDDDLPYDNYAWMHPIWSYAWDTHWKFKSLNDLKNAKTDALPNRGKESHARRKEGARNKVFIVHHFLTDLVGGSKSHASKVNRKAVLRQRLLRLAKEAHHIPNIVQVDFFQYPNNDIFDVIDELNGTGCYEGKPLYKF